MRRGTPRPRRRRLQAPPWPPVATSPPKSSAVARRRAGSSRTASSPGWAPTPPASSSSLPVAGACSSRRTRRRAWRACRCPAPEPIEENVYVPTAAGPRLVGRGAQGALSIRRSARRGRADRARADLRDDEAARVPGPGRGEVPRGWAIAALLRRRDGRGAPSAGLAGRRARRRGVPRRARGSSARRRGAPPPDAGRRCYMAAAAIAAPPHGRARRARGGACSPMSVATGGCPSTCRRPARSARAFPLPRSRPGSGRAHEPSPCSWRGSATSSGDVDASSSDPIRAGDHARRRRARRAPGWRSGDRCSGSTCARAITRASLRSRRPSRWPRECRMGRRRPCGSGEEAGTIDTSGSQASCAPRAAATPGVRPPQAGRAHRRPGAPRTGARSAP